MFYVFFPLFCTCFIVFSVIVGGFCVFFGFVLTACTLTCKKSGNFEISCRLSTAEKCNSHPFSICFVCAFPLLNCFVQSSLFFNFFDGFCVIFLASFSPLSPWPAKSQETSKLVADWALLRNAIPSLFPFVLLKFSWLLMDFGSFLPSFSSFSSWIRKKKTAFQ